MGFFSRLFGANPNAKPKVTGVRLAGTGLFDFEIVGEARRQRELESITGGRTEDGCEHVCVATLWREPTNPADKNAVRIEIDKSHVGYLRRENAADYCQRMRALGYGDEIVGACAALIVGGWDRGDGDRGNFGVKLDLKWPIEEHKT